MITRPRGCPIPVLAETSPNAAATLRVQLDTDRQELLRHGRQDAQTWVLHGEPRAGDEWAQVLQPPVVQNGLHRRSVPAEDDRVERDVAEDPGRGIRRRSEGGRCLVGTPPGVALLRPATGLGGPLDVAGTTLGRGKRRSVEDADRV